MKRPTPNTTPLLATGLALLTGFLFLVAPAPGESPNLITAGNAEAPEQQKKWIGHLQLVADDRHAGSAAFEMFRIGSTRCTELVEIDKDQNYEISGWFKSKEPDQLSRMLLDVRYYTADKKPIHPMSVNPISGISELVKDIDVGDKVVKVRKTDWPMKLKLDLTGLAFNAQEDLSDLPNNKVVGLKAIESKEDVYEVALGRPAAQAYAKGTKVRLHRYLDHPRVYDNHVPTEWKRYAFVVGKDGGRRKKLWPGAEYMSLFIINHYNQYPKKLPKGEKSPVLLFDDITLTNVAKQEVAKPETEKNEPKAQTLAQPDGGQTITLAKSGRALCQIVAAPDADGIEAYAAKTLADYLKEMTGAEFPVVSPNEYKADRPAIFVGLSEPALARLGPEPLAKLRDQEHVARSIGPDILLYGKGHRASLDAVMEFLENSLGWQWYSVLEKPVVPKRATLTLKPFSRKRGFDFVSRQLSLRFSAAFYLQHGVNMGLETKLLQRRQAVPGYFKSWLLNENFVHTSFSYIPPTPNDRLANGFQWVTKRDYFLTNPEFYSVSESGKRVPNLQLCYSNRGLRDELTRQVRRHIKISGQRQLIMIDAFDRPGRFCHCDGCIALEKRYQTPGGPLFDYLIELCNALKLEHPETRVKTLSYRRSQTQVPPRLPEGEKLPDNLVIAFAPIEDCYFADWTHPDSKIQETFQHLKDWAAITAPKNLWAWMYPNPWGTGHEMPVGNIERTITNMRLMHKAGVRGIFLDHHGTNSRSGWSELQAFLVLKLSQDIEADTDALITEFTDHAFGPAAPQMRQYLAELETARKAMTSLPPQVGYKSRNLDDRTFPYLTPANLHRWQQLFENMEAATASLPVERANVRSQRRELDIATLWKWFDLRADWPDVYTDHRKVAERILAANKAKAPSGVAPAWSLGDPLIAHFATLIDAGGEKPLPAEFDGIARDRIRTFLPRNGARGKIKRSVKDPEAAFGTATVVDQPQEPFRCGFSEWKSRVPSVVTHGPRLEIQRDQMTPGQYRLYPLGEIDLTTDDSMIWFGRSWQTNLRIGSQLYFPGEINRWKAWVSLKFTGPNYGGKGENLVLCDRVILVRSNNAP